MQFGDIVVLREFNRGKWIFKDIYGYGYPFYHIHPYKQEVVKYLVDNTHDFLDYLIIFGSSVQTCHKWWKDLDVCIISGDRGDIVKVSDLIEVDCDILHYNTLDYLYSDMMSVNDVKTRIVEEGVMVYGKI